MKPHKPYSPTPNPWLIAALAFGFIFWLTAVAYCQDSPTPHRKAIKPVYHDSLVQCTAVEVKRLFWGSYKLVHTHSFWMRYTLDDCGHIDTKHVTFYYPNHLTTFRMVWWTDLPNSPTDSSRIYDLIGQLKTE